MNILISSVGRRGALVRIFKAAVGAFGAGCVLATDASPLSSAGHLADHFEVVPRCSSNRFLTHMLELCQKWRIDAIIPTIDSELMVYAINRKMFADIGTTVLISSEETIDIAADKRRTHSWLIENDIPTVPTAPLPDVLADQASWKLPLIVKPTRGSASIGVLRAESWHELERREPEPDLIVQTAASGKEYTVDAWIDRNGDCVCVVPRQRLEVRAGEVQKAITVHWPALERLAHRIANTLPGAYGAINMQIFADKDDFAVIEVNPRFGGGYPLSWQAGADFPRWFLEDVSGSTGSHRSSEWQDGLIMLRFDDAVFIDGTTVEL